MIPPERLRVGRIAEQRVRLRGLKRREEAVMLTLLAKEEGLKAHSRLKEGTGDHVRCGCGPGCSDGHCMGSMRGSWQSWRGRPEGTSGKWTIYRTIVVIDEVIDWL